MDELLTVSFASRVTRPPEWVLEGYVPLGNVTLAVSDDLHSQQAFDFAADLFESHPKHVHVVSPLAEYLRVKPTGQGFGWGMDHRIRPAMYALVALAQENNVAVLGVAPMCAVEGPAGQIARSVVEIKNLSMRLLRGSYVKESPEKYRSVYYPTI